MGLGNAVFIVPSTVLGTLVGSAADSGGGPAMSDPAQGFGIPDTGLNPGVGGRVCY
jgi:hypothetical protein